MRLCLRKLAILVLSAGYILGPIDAFADEKLQSRVEQLVLSLKTQGSHAAALDFVYWDYAFTRVDSQARERLGIKTPELLKSRIKGVVSDPIAMFERAFEKRAGNYNPAQRELLRRTFETRAQTLRADWKKSQAEMARANYKVSSITLDPADAQRAHVALIKADDETGEALTYNFEKHGEQWYVTTDIASAGLEALQLN
jgi:hypothetical protein